MGSPHKVSLSLPSPVSGPHPQLLEKRQGLSSNQKGAKGQQPWETGDTKQKTPGLEPHIILSLQVPGLLAQKAEDVGEVLVTNLIKHLQGEPDSDNLPERTLTGPPAPSSVMGAQEECPAVPAKPQRGPRCCHQCQAPAIMLRGSLLAGGGAPPPGSASPPRVPPRVAQGRPTSQHPRTLTLSSALSSTFKLLSEDVTSGPKSTLPLRAEGAAMRISREGFPPLPFPELPLGVPQTIWKPAVCSESEALPQALPPARAPRELRTSPPHPPRQDATYHT